MVFGNKMLKMFGRKGAKISISKEIKWWSIVGYMFRNSAPFLIHGSPRSVMVSPCLTNKQLLLQFFWLYPNSCTFDKQHFYCFNSFPHCNV